MSIGQSGINFNEVMAVLDIVKNESVYNERLAELKNAEERLNISRFMVTTMEQASLVLDKAKEEEAKYKKLIVDSKDEIETLRRKKLEDVEKREELVRKREASVVVLEETLQDKIFQLEQERKSVTDRLLVIRKEEIDTENINKEVKFLRNTLEDKMKRIKQIFNE